MNHHDFPILLFEADEDLTADQKLKLHKHLQTCVSCKALSEALVDMETAISRASMVEPETGFSARWHSRLQAERVRVHKIQTVRTLTIMIAGFVILGAAMFFLRSPWLHAPNQLVWTWIYQYFSLLSYLSSFKGIVVTLFSTTPVISPWVIAGLSVGLMSELAVLWVVFFRLITKTLRVTA